MSTKPLPEFEQFAAARRYGGNNGYGMAWSPDSRELAYVTNISGQFNLWKQPAKGGYPVQLTFYSDQAVRMMAWAPDGETILFMADLNGNEFHQLYTIRARGGTPVQLTNVSDAIHRINSGAWSPDGRYIVYATNEANRRNVGVVIRDVHNGEIIPLIDDDGNFFPAGWSPDGRQLLAVQQHNNTDSDIFLINVEQQVSGLSGKTTGAGLHNTPGSAPGRVADDAKPSADMQRTKQNLTAHTGEIVYSPGPWSREKDKPGFYFTSNERGEFEALGFYELPSGKREWVQTPEWDVEMAAVSRNGRLLASVVNEDGYSRLKLRELKKNRKVKLPKMPEGVIHYMSFAPNSRKLALLMGGATYCAQPFVLSLKKKEIAPLTHSMLGGIEQKELVEPQLIHYETFDSKRVPAWLYKPHDVSGRIPVILAVHGGPEAQERPEYNYVSSMYQYWLSRGIAILATNIRGSTGYGKSYQMLIHRDWGGGDLRDMEHAVKYLHTLDWVDPQRIGFFGGSYGGYACLSCVARLPELFSVAVGWFGPSNLVTFVESVPPYWKSFMKAWVGDAVEDADLLIERSPITYVNNVRTPLFIVQGALDPRVVQAESDQFVERLRARGVPVRYDVYVDEGHGFTKRANELKALKDSAEFLEQRLMG